MFQFKEFQSSQQGNCAICKAAVKQVKQTKVFSDDEDVKDSVYRCVCCERVYCGSCKGLNGAVQAVKGVSGEEMKESVGQNFSMPNEVEYQRLMAQFSVEHIWDNFILDLKVNYFIQIPLGKYYISYDSKCCKRCFQSLFYAACIWQMTKCSSKIPECELGFSCKQQFLDYQHSQNYSHSKAGKVPSNVITPFQ